MNFCTKCTKTATQAHTHCQMLNWFGDKQRYFYCLLTHTDEHWHTRRHFKAGSRGLIDTLSFDATTSRNDWFSHTKLRASAPERGSPRETNARFALSAQLCELSLSLCPLCLSLSRSLLSSFVVDVVVVVVVVRLTNFGSVCIRNQFATLAGVQMCECWAVCECVCVCV